MGLSTSTRRNRPPLSICRPIAKLLCRTCFCCYCYCCSCCAQESDRRVMGGLAHSCCQSVASYPLNDWHGGRGVQACSLSPSLCGLLAGACLTRQRRHDEPSRRAVRAARAIICTTGQPRPRSRPTMECWIYDWAATHNTSALLTCRTPPPFTATFISSKLWAI